jgi:hypothetical protein
MRADNRADWLFVLMAGEGFATLMWAWALLLLAAHAADPSRFTAPGVAFAVFAILLLLTCTVAKHLRATTRAPSAVHSRGPRRGL